MRYCFRRGCGYGLVIIIFFFGDEPFLVVILLNLLACYSRGWE